MEAALWVIVAAVGLFALDRLLLWFESRGWIYYRRTKAGRGASTYHLLEWTSVLDPTQKQVQVEMTREEKRQDEAGNPLGPTEDPPGLDEDSLGPHGDPQSPSRHVPDPDRPRIPRDGSPGDPSENPDVPR